MVAGGVLTNLNMTVDSNFDLGGVTFTASGLNFDYNSSGAGSFSMSGTAGVKLAGRTTSRPLWRRRHRWARDHGRQPVQPRRDDQLQFPGGRRHVHCFGPGFRLQRSGRRKLLDVGDRWGPIGGVDNLTVIFGAGGTAGLVITGGSLSSLDMTINSNFEVAGVTFTASGLNFDYNSSGAGSFSMSGSVGVTVAGIDGLTVTFGSGGIQGS